MSLIDKLKEEIKAHPEKGKELIEEIAEVYSEFSLVLQIRELLIEMRDIKEEQRNLREDFNREIMKIWKEIKAIKEEQACTWQEIAALKEEQTKIWKEISEIKSDIKKIWQEIAALKEEQTKIWKEIKAIKEEQVRLREDFNRMIEEIKELKKNYYGLRREMDQMYRGLSSAILYGFGELSKFAGITFEEFVRRFLTDRMRRSGEIPPEATLKSAEVGGEQIDIFLEDPLIVGEVTAHASSVEEIEKLVRKISKVREIYKKEPRKILIVETAPKEVARGLKELAEKEGIELIVGKEV